MKNRSLSADGDWVFGNGISDYKINNEAIILLVKQRLKEFYKDCFFNYEAGLDWLNVQKDTDLFATQVKAIIANTNGVVKITDFVFDLLPNRNLDVRFRMNTIYGSVEQNIILSQNV